MIKTKKKIIITGTHLTPALELIRQLQSDPKNDWEISYIGRQSNSNDPASISIESQIIPSLGIDFYSISCGKFDRRYFPNTIAGIPKTIFGFFQSFFLLKKIQPDIVVSFGGYVSVPVIINSKLNHIKSITHEQTLTNSLTTKINSHFVDKVALSFDHQKQISQLPPRKVVITGNLLRYELFQKQLIIPKDLKLNANKLPIIYITAGNQGSHSINLSIKKILPLLKNFNIIHQTGKNDFPFFKNLTKKYPNYLVADYFNTADFSWIINNSNILISRSGANTSQEIVAFSKKSILIPLPQSQQNEQLLNALWVQEKLPQETIIIDQSNLNSQNLLLAISKLEKINSLVKKTITKPNLNLFKLINEII